MSRKKPIPPHRGMVSFEFTIPGDPNILDIFFGRQWRELAARMQIESWENEGGSVR